VILPLPVREQRPDGCMLQSCDKRQQNPKQKPRANSDEGMDDQVDHTGPDT
jgi:hypothetical protein